MIADKATLSSLSGDPRRPDLAVPYKRPTATEESPDALSTIGMLLGLIGLLARVPVFSYLAIAFIISAYIQKKPDTDVKNLIMSGMFSMMGIFYSQFPPPGRAASNSTATAAAAAAAGAGAQAAGST